MTGYTMAMLGNPSSPDEIQGTNATQLYEGTSATVISSKPKLVIQALGDADPRDADLGRGDEPLDSAVPSRSRLPRLASLLS